MSIEKQVNAWISSAYQQGASDLHFEPASADKMRVRMRLDGELRLLDSVSNARQIMSRLKIMSDLDLNQHDIPMDGRIDTLTHCPGCPGLDIRVSTLPTTNGEKAVLRLIDNRKLNTKLEKLGFSKKMLRVYEPMIQQSNGLILHVGPTGSGKTTSLYTVIQTLKKKDINIQTVENPVEYAVFGITQTQVEPEQGLTFPRVLRALLRQDPDVILVGEIRDAETAEIATEAAMTGHLVLSTLHTNDAVGTVVRLLDMGVAPYAIAYSLRCIVSQRFVKRLCSSCRRAMQPPERVIRVTGSRRQIYQAKGCGKCGRNGYKGRIPLFEYLPNSLALSQAVYGSVSPGELQDIATKNGLISMWDDGLEKVWTGETSLEEILRSVRGVKGRSSVSGGARAAKRPAGGSRRPPPSARPPRRR